MTVTRRSKFPFSTPCEGKFESTNACVHEQAGLAVYLYLVDAGPRWSSAHSREGYLYGFSVDASIGEFLDITPVWVPLAANLGGVEHSFTGNTSTSGSTPMTRGGDIYFWIRPRLSSGGTLLRSLLRLETGIGRPVPLNLRP